MPADVYGNITFGVCTQNTKKDCCHIYGFALSAASNENMRGKNREKMPASIA